MQKRQKNEDEEREIERARRFTRSSALEFLSCVNTVILKNLRATNSEL